MNHFDRDKLSAIEAKQEAQRIAFAPFMFQAAKALRDMGVLAAIEAGGDEGLALDDIRQRTGHSLYAVRVLAEAGLGIGMLILREERFVLTRLGWYVLNDPMTRVNMDFTQDINFKGLFHLQESLTTGTPAGLKEIAPGFPTLYEALGTLPEPLKASWFGFDHFYSDNSFRSVLPVIFGQPTASILDVGANTGKWAVACAEYARDVRITMCDLPGQLAQARPIIEHRGLAARVSEYPIDVLRPDTALPGGHDVIWMSQFLDCFSEEEVISILTRVAQSIGKDSKVYIMETLWDRQRYETASYCLTQISLYFTAMANGNSKMFHSDDLIRCIENAGLEVEEIQDNIGLGHSILQCRLK